MKIRLYISILFSSLILASSTSALGIIKKDAIYNIKTEIVQNDNFNKPDSIIITPITIPVDKDIDDYDWYKGLLYYQGIRIDQGDFLFHYLITSEGKILQGNSKGIDQRFKIEDVNNRPIIIGYFAHKNQNDFSIDAKQALKEFLLILSNENSIDPANISLKTISNKIVKDQPVKIILSFAGGMWEVSMKSIIREITPNYKPIQRPYSLTIDKVELPNGKVSYGDETVMKITIKNNSQYILYQESTANILISKADNTPSLFFYNNIWSSRSQSEIMPEGAFIKPSESKTFTVKLGVPLHFGIQSEKFHLTDILGQVYPGSDFTISLDINRPATQVVEITNTETGQLNVRESPWSSSPVIQRVTPGQRYFVQERNDKGWLKIDLGNGKSGWVVARYTKVV